MKKLNLFVLFATTMIISTACFGEQPAEIMYDHLEESVQIEKEVEEKQEPLTNAEQKEVDLYEEMLTLSSVEEIEPLADEAIDSAEERREIMEEEKELIEDSYSIFQEAEQQIDDIDEEDVQEAATKVVDTMNERYSVYQDLYEEYMQSIDEDILLYEMAKDEEIEVEVLQEQHEKVNEGYNRITELNQQFNQLTNDYNDAKINFYETAELNVVFE
ncbi:YkyA family protein [Salipaludibacillus daqingensis]|uniref:YkyA family protein n=1 Tax=Salipaludibacillus daqingensis TaxID=3041001 RepID=UPI00247619A5|nr:YkyA family protein [Salipaludibacillus daqingensis]